MQFLNPALIDLPLRVDQIPYKPRRQILCTKVIARQRDKGEVAVRIGGDDIIEQDIL